MMILQKLHKNELNKNKIIQKNGCKIEAKPHTLIKYYKKKFI